MLAMYCTSQSVARHMSVRVCVVVAEHDAVYEVQEKVQELEKVRPVAASLPLVYLPLSPVPLTSAHLPNQRHFRF